MSHGFGVIDINIPQHITVNDEDNPDYHETDVEYASTMTDVARKEGEKLAMYLWENYVEPYEFPGGIFLMGAGTAFHAMAKLVSENETVYTSLLGIIGFIATNPIRPISNPGVHWISQWYRENSLVYVSQAHSVWKKDTGKTSKRYGRLTESPGEVLNVMMKMHEGEVMEWMKEKVRRAYGESDDEDEDSVNGETKESDGDAVDELVPTTAAAASEAGPAMGVTSQSATTAQRMNLGGDVFMTTEH